MAFDSFLLLLQQESCSHSSHSTHSTPPRLTLSCFIGPRIRLSSQSRIFSCEEDPLGIAVHAVHAALYAIALIAGGGTVVVIAPKLNTIFAQQTSLPPSYLDVETFLMLVLYRIYRLGWYRQKCSRPSHWLQDMILGGWGGVGVTWPNRGLQSKAA